MKMKRFFITMALLLIFAPAYGFAQMGHGMMRETPGGMMHEHMMGHEGMMGYENMMGNMTDMINELSGLMSKMSEMMKDMPRENMHQISSTMRDTCSEMSRMSEMMDKGAATDEEIKAVHHRIKDLQKRMSEMEK